MYGLGVYLADMAQKSHRYVRGQCEHRRDVDGHYYSETDFLLQYGGDGRARWEAARRDSCTVYTMLRCQTNLGSPFLIEGNLTSKDGMHDVCRPVDPSDWLDHCPEEYDHRRSNTSYFVKGQGGATWSGRAVVNNEYVVFQPWQVWPRYIVHYTFDH